MVRLVRVFAFLALLIGGATASAAERGFAFKSYVLDNGLQVVVFPNHRAPIVNQTLWYRVGSADEPKGVSGIAHFLEHLMFKGTPSVPPGEFSKIVARNGGRDNAFTSYDYTGYFQTIAADRLELVMRMEADRMANLVLADDQVLPERDVILEERRSRTDNSPAALLSEAVIEALFGPEGYGIPIIGYEREMRQLSRADAIAFYGKHYAPNNAILVVAGDVDPERVRELAQHYFGAYKRADLQPRTRPFRTAIHGPAHVERRDARVQQAQWSRDFLAPSYVAGETRHAVPLQVLAYVLGGNQNSRLNLELVVKDKVASQASSWYSPTALGQTTFGVSATPAAGVALKTVEEAVEREIARIRDQGVTAEELARAKLQLLAANVYALDSLTSGARIYGGQLAIGRTVEQIGAWPDQVEAVTAEQVQEAARHVFGADNHVTSALLPADPAGEKK
ncbi:MAG: M16 family metallopeptidase [Reyranellaceae bacterium]